jgi:predicted metal-dependent peptidase
MRKNNLGDALRVCVDVMRQTGVMNVWYMEADTTVQKPPTRVSIRDLYHMEVKGRGGTDFRPAIQMADQARPRPNAVIYLSDGDGYAPDTPPDGITFIWGIVPGSSRRAPASWGETVFLEDSV